MKNNKIIALFLCLGALGFVGNSLADDNTNNLDLIYYEAYDLDEAVGFKNNTISKESSNSKNDNSIDGDLGKATDSINEQIERENTKDKSNKTSGTSDTRQGSKDNFPYPAGDRPIENQSTIYLTSRNKNYTADNTYGPIKGNRLTGVYHTKGQRDYNKISVNNVTWFYSEKEASDKGYSHAQR